MSGKGKVGRHGKRALSPDEAELWTELTKSVRPLPSSSRHIGPTQSDATRAVGPVHPHRVGESASSEPKSGRSTTHTTLAKNRTKPNMPRAVPAILDRRRARRIASGHEEIEARLDLHGLRQDEAHRALRGFLARAHASGQRTVLVITGKGRVSEPDTHGHAFGSAREHGVLKQNVPRWLREADLARFVVSYAKASPRHGGEGALYVQLRRHRPK